VGLTKCNPPFILGYSQPQINQILLAGAPGLVDQLVDLLEHAFLVHVRHSHYLGLQQPHCYRLSRADDGTQAAAIALAFIDCSLKLLGWCGLFHFDGIEETPVYAVVATGTELFIDYGAEAALLQYLLYVTNLHTDSEDVTTFPAAAAYRGQLFRRLGSPCVNQACFLSLTGDGNGLISRDRAAGAPIYGILSPAIEMQTDIKREIASPDRSAAGTGDHRYRI